MFTGCNNDHPSIHVSDHLEYDLHMTGGGDELLWGDEIKQG